VIALGLARLSLLPVQLQVLGGLFINTGAEHITLEAATMQPVLVDMVCCFGGAEVFNSS
jgi:hypothetical protein